MNENKNDALSNNYLNGRTILSKDRERLVRWMFSQPAPIQAVLSKLVDNQDKNKHNGEVVPMQTLKGVSERGMQDILDIRIIKENLPELITIKDILVSSILSPNDFISERLNWTYESDIHPKVATEMLNVIEEHFATQKLEERLSEFLGNALFDRGSHILAVFPESAIDDIINERSESSLESIRYQLRDIVDIKSGYWRGSGVLGRGLKQLNNDLKGQAIMNRGLESHFNPHYSQAIEGDYQDIIPGLVRVVDNINVIKAPHLHRRLAEAKIRNSYLNFSAESIGFNVPLMEEEAADALPIKEVFRKVTKRSYKGIGAVNDRDTSSRKPLSHPLVVDLPHEATIPVCSPGRPTDHLGYLVLLDGLGNPLTVDNIQSDLNSLGGNYQRMRESLSKSTSIGGAQTVVSQTLTELNELVGGGGDCKVKSMRLDELTAFYGRMIERDLMSRLNDGIYGENVQISHPDEIYRIMLARSLAGSMTQILYIPESLVTYIAFDYNSFGMGQSLIMQTRTLAALRIATKYANHTAVVKNAIGTRTLRITLDEADEHPEETIAKAISTTMEQNSSAALFNSIDPRHVEEEIRRSGWEVVVEGNEGLETTQITTERKEGERAIIDNEFEDKNRDAYISTMIPTQLLEDVSQANFASEFITKNVLFAKRNVMKSMRFSGFITDHVRKYVLHDGALIKQLSAIIRENYQSLNEELIQEMKRTNSTIPAIRRFLDDIWVGLPLPTLESDENLKQAFESFQQRVESMLPSLLSDEVLNDIFNDFPDDTKSEAMTGLRERFKNVLISRWVMQNGVFPEFADFLAASEEERKNMMSIFSDNQGAIATIFANVIDEMRRRYNPQAGGEEGGDDYSSDDSSAASGEDDEFSIDDDSSDDLSMDENSDTADDTGDSNEEDTDTDSEDDADADTEDTSDDGDHVEKDDAADDLLDDLEV